MSKNLIPAFMIIITLLLSSCTSMSNDIKGIPIQGLKLVPIDYTIIGDTTAEETRMAVFGVDWAHIFYDEATRNINETNSFYNSYYFILPLEFRARRAALYKALKKIPEADRLLEPRWTVTIKNYLIATSVTVTVTAKAIAYTKSGSESK